jgi:hypothetical protein
MGFLNRIFGLSSPPKFPDLPPIDHLVLGRLTWDREAGWWVGLCRRMGQEACTVYVSPPMDTEFAPSDAQVTRFQSVIEKFDTIRDESVREFLPSFNRDWMEGEIISHEDFLAMLIVESLAIDSDGEIAISLANKNEETNDILGGHVVRIVISLDGSRDVGLEG